MLNLHVRDGYTRFRVLCKNRDVSDGVVKHAQREVERATNAVEHAYRRIDLAEAQLSEARAARLAAFAELEKACKALVKVSP